MSLITRVNSQGTFAQNTPWLSPGYTPQVRASRAVDLILQIQVNSGNLVEVEATLNDTDYFPINSNAVLPEGWSQFDIFAEPGDIVNFRTPNVAGISVNFRLIADFDG